MLRRYPILVAALIVLSQFAAAAEKQDAKLQPIAYAKPLKLADLANQKITESSGVDASRRAKDVFWTHNDSGDRPRIYAFNAKGEDLGTFDITGAQAADWEDMASAKIGRTSYLLLGDVGDNNARRKNCTIYLVKEPRLPARKKPVTGKLKVAKAIRFEYADGPRNCESIAIDPAARTIYLVSKVARPLCKVYAFRIPKGKRPATAKPVAVLNIPITTAMDISPDGRRCIVLTYGHAYEYARKTGEKWKGAFAREPREIKMPGRAQGESICYGSGGKTLYLTSEKLPTPLWEVPAVVGDK